MNIHSWPIGSAERILEALNEEGIRYDQPMYSALISPSSAIISKQCAAKIEHDIRTIWEWSRQSAALYAELIERRDEHSELVQACEWGLTPDAVALQRESSRLGEEPGIGRIDAVKVEGDQQIAEIQWKGGGEGFIAAIDEQYRHLFPQREDQSHFGHLAERWADAFRSTESEDEVCVLNTGRSVWMDSEQWLAKKLAPRGITMVSLPPSRVAESLIVDNDRVLVNTGKGFRKLDYLYLDRLTEVIPPELLQKIIGVSRDGRLRIDPPPSYLFNEKVPLALPFTDEYRRGFSGRIREILIPSALMHDGKPDLSAVASSLDHPGSSVLSEMNQWEDLLKVPRSLREQLVFKCASAHKTDNHGGHGVWRLWGSTSVAGKVLNEVLSRVRGKHEPWIVQKYVQETFTVPFAHPEYTEEIQTRTAHARFGIYCSMQRNRPLLLGGIATFSPFWKVAGKAASRDKDGRLNGSAFTDIRVQ
ncbi:MAG: hypothetical protein AAB489_01415 [Patescibacteria group bacterium]